MQLTPTKIVHLILASILCSSGLFILVRHTKKADLSRIQLTTTAPVKQSDTTKKELWNKMSKEVKGWGDALGMPIDPGIKNTIIVLNLLGFKTEQSCEGHIGWGRLYPWVSITTQHDETNTLENERIDVLKRIEQAESDTHEQYPGTHLRDILAKDKSQNKKLTALYNENHAINNKIDKLSSMKIIKLNELIGDFYKTNPIDSGTMLVLYRFNPTTFNLFNLDGQWQVIRDKKERSKKMVKYQREIQLFTDFLIDYYFQS